MQYRRRILPGVAAILVIAWATSAQAVKPVQAVYDTETEDFGLPRTDEIRRDGYEAPTPTEIRGATTITTLQFRDMLADAPQPIVIDVIGGEQTQSVPGAVWLPGAGRGTDVGDATQVRLKAALTSLTAGDPGRRLVFLCLSKTCWLSHNATVRAVALGYNQVFW
jgi:PQQ-dependent catabolism-associated CXXCW motif protein